MRFIHILLAFFIFAVNLSTAATSCAVGLMVAFTLYRGFRYRDWPRIDKQIAYLFLAYFVIQIIVAALSINPLISFREVLGEIHRCFPLFFAMAYIKSQDHMKYIILAFLFSVSLNDLVALIQHYYWNHERVTALAHTPTFYASFLLMQIPFLIWIITLKFMPTWSRAFSAVLTIISMLCLIFTVTRGAWLAF